MQINRVGIIRPRCHAGNLLATRINAAGSHRRTAVNGKAAAIQRRWVRARAKGHSAVSTQIQRVGQVYFDFLSISSSGNVVITTNNAQRLVRQSHAARSGGAFYG